MAPAGTSSTSGGNGLKPFMNRLKTMRKIRQETLSPTIPADDRAAFGYRIYANTCGNCAHGIHSISHCQLHKIPVDIHRGICPDHEKGGCR